MKDIFYRPNLGEEREFRSEEEFIGPKNNYYSDVELERPDVKPEEIEDLDEIEETEDIEETIDELIKVMEDIPIDILDSFKETIEIIKEDLLTIKPGVPEPFEPKPIVVKPVETTRPVTKPTYRDKETTSGETPTEKKRIKIFGRDNGIEVILEQKNPILVDAKNSFIKDKQDMYRHFVEKLKMMLQQHMREVLYIAIKGGFDSYKDLYIKYSTPTGEVPKKFAHVSDSMVKSQIVRDQKNRLLKKTFNVDQTIFHLTSNKAIYEQRARYYELDYMAAEDYLTTKENDELRRSRDAYNNKYDQSMYNYYKYLNSSVKVAEEVLQGFVSEARGKAILKKNGIDPAAGVKKEEALRTERETTIQKQNEDEKIKADERLVKNIIIAGGAGRASNFPGSYEGGDASSLIGGSATGVGSTATAGTGMYKANITNDIMSQINAIRNDASLSNGEKIVSMAKLCYELRGVNSSNRIRYDMNGASKNTILSKDTKRSDCSSFTQGVAMYAMGINIGSYTGEQVTKNKGRHWVYDQSEIMPGDFLYLAYKSGDSYSGHRVTMPNGKALNVTHVSIYIGDGKVIHCTSGADGIETLNVASGWANKFITTQFAGAFRL